MKSISVLKMLFVLILLTISIGVFLSVQAADEAGLSISPLVFELNADPGDSISNQVKIFNPTQYPQNVKMKVEDFTPYGEEGYVYLEEPDEDSTFSIANWTTISPSEFVLDPEEQQVVNFTVNVPDNGEPGGHYGSIVAMLSGGTDTVGGTGAASKRGALVLLRVSGDIREGVAVNTFTTKSFQEFGPVEFDLKFENTGNVHVRPAGFITITDTFGKQVAELEIPQNNVIPGAVRDAGVTWEDTTLLGRYTATVVANYGSASKETITSVTTFTVFPWKRGLVIGAGVLILLFILIKARKRLATAFRVLIGKKR